LIRIFELINQDKLTIIWSKDGVILNMASLYKLIPWKEPEKYYKELQQGKYQWSQISRIFKDTSN